MRALLRCATAMEKHKPYIAMIFIQLVYAGLSMFSKAAISQGMKPSVFVAYRQGFATIALAPLAYFFESKNAAHITGKILCKIFFVSLCGISLSLNLFYFGLNYVSATFASAVTSTIPTMVFIMAVVFRIESLSINQWHGIAKVLGSVVCLSGVMLFTFYKGSAVYSGGEKENSHPSTKYISKGDWIIGSLLMLTANLTWSLWLIMQRPIIKQYPSKLRLTTLQCLFSCMTSSLWAVAVDRNISSWKLGWDINLISVVYCGVVVTGITYWLQVWIVDKKGPVFTAAFNPLALILTAIFSALFFKETLHWGSVCGALLLVVGLYSFLWGKKRESENAKNEQKIETKEGSVVLECVTTHQ